MKTPAILIISCDKYRDLWRPFFTLFRKRWPDCPFPVYLGTNSERYDDHDVTTICIGPDVSWTTGAKQMLHQIDAEHVITFLEDFFIEQPVDTTKIVRLVEIARNEKIGCLRLAAGAPLASPPSYPVAEYPELGVIERGELYRANAQVAIWRRATLDSLLVDGANPWEFEVIGSVLSDRCTEPFWAVYEPAIQYDHGIEKGKWKPKALRVAAEAGVTLDLAARAVFSDAELAEHLRLAAAEPTWQVEKRKAIAAFKQGNRRVGVRAIARGLRDRPYSVQLWGIVLAGVIGGRAMRWIQVVHLNLRIARVRGRMLVGNMVGRH